MYIGNRNGNILMVWWVLLTLYPLSHIHSFSSLCINFCFCCIKSQAQGKRKKIIDFSFFKLRNVNTDFFFWQLVLKFLSVSCHCEMSLSHSKSFTWYCSKNNGYFKKFMVMQLISLSKSRNAVKQEAVDSKCSSTSVSISV